jgi:phosphoribosylformimino-5-aminoimidazole carboxamide ribotide isomerase
MKGSGSDMLVIPAVDLKDGRCVRLWQGRLDAETVYSDDPVAIAQAWVDQGAAWLHVVDLDGAVEGTPRNLSVIQQIVRTVSVPVQVGGGIRSIERIERYLAVGAARLIIGTLALEEPSLAADICRRFAGQIAVSLDARDGRVASRGWLESPTRDYLSVARQIAAWQPSVLIFTAIQRDGTLAGPDLPRLHALLQVVQLPVIAAGGIGHLGHLQSLVPLAAAGLSGVIIGKALYEGVVTLREALATMPRA